MFRNPKYDLPQCQKKVWMVRLLRTLCYIWNLLCRFQTISIHNAMEEFSCSPSSHSFDDRGEDGRLRTAQWVETLWNWRNQFIDMNRFPMCSGVSEWASEASSAEQAIEWAMWANERAEQRMDQYSTRQFLSHSTQRGMHPSHVTEWMHRPNWWRDWNKRQKEESEARETDPSTSVMLRPLSLSSHWRLGRGKWRWSEWVATDRADVRRSTK